MVFHDFGSKFNGQKNGHHWNAPIMLITLVQVPASYLLPSPRYLYSLVPRPPTRPGNDIVLIPTLVYPLSKERHVVSMHLNEL